MSQHSIPYALLRSGVFCKEPYICRKDKRGKGRAGRGWVGIGWIRALGVDGLGRTFGQRVDTYQV